MVDRLGTLAGTIAVVFVRREYGLMEGFRTIIDIGGNMGSFSVYAAQRCPSAKIYCYEPDPRNFECLSQNLKLNGLENRVVPNQCAVASTSGKRSMAGSLSPLHSLVQSDATARGQLVECTTLADILKTQNLREVDLLKMNCEGAEYEILENCAPEVLARIRNIRLEYHLMGDGKNNGASLCRLLKNQGFTIERFTQYKTESGFIWAARP